MNEKQVGKYTLLERIGGGAMGRTYRGQDNSDKIVCVKELRFGTSTIEDQEEADQMKKLFKREAETLKQLDLPVIPSLLDYFTETSESGEQRHYMVQEYVEGESLAEIVKNGGQLPITDVVTVAGDVLNVLEYIHSYDPPIIHRDIKPANLIKAKDGKIHVVDFGGVQVEAVKTLGVSTLLGTLGYAPIELFGTYSEPKTDIYSLGATMFRLLTGIEPEKVTDKTTRKLQIVKEDIPHRKMRKLIEGMTHVDLEKRMSSTEVRERLYEMGGAKENSLVSVGMQGVPSYGKVLLDTIKNNKKDPILKCGYTLISPFAAVFQNHTLSINWKKVPEFEADFLGYHKKDVTIWDLNYWIKGISHVGTLAGYGLAAYHLSPALLAIPVATNTVTWGIKMVTDSQKERKKLIDHATARRRRKLRSINL